VLRQGANGAERPLGCLLPFFVGKLVSSPDRPDSAIGRRRPGLALALRRVTLAAALLSALTVYAVAVHQASQMPWGGDFIKFYVSARELVRGGDIYRPVLLPEVFPERSIPPGADGILDPNLNPPFQTLLLAPLGFLDYETAFVVWGTFSILSGILGAILLSARVASGQDRLSSALGSAVVLLAFLPSLISVQLGQWTFVPFLLLVLAWTCWREDRTLIAGSILGLLASIKLFFGAFFVLILARRSWRAALGFVATWVLCAGVSGATAGFGSFPEYRSILQQADWFSHSWNASFLGFFTRLFGSEGNVGLLQAPALGPAVGYGFAGLALVSLFLDPRRTVVGVESKRAKDLAFATCIPVMLLASPFGWLYYLPFLLIPVAVLWEAGRGIPGGRMLRILAVVAWLLGCVPSGIQDPLWPQELTGNPTVVLWDAGTYFYSLLLFWGLARTMAGHATRIPPEYGSVPRDLAPGHPYPGT
jgi:hypothetical protein